MQFLPAHIKRVSAENDWRIPVLTLTVEKAIVYPHGARAVLYYLEGGRLRVVGSIILE
jgi:hypothetical protein